MENRNMENKISENRTMENRSIEIIMEIWQNANYFMNKKIYFIKYHKTQIFFNYALNMKT